MQITLRQLEIFAAICQEASITQAARRVGLSQAATSQALAELENQLQRRLFDRHGRRIAENAAGRDLLPAAIEVPPGVVARPMRDWERQVLFNLICFIALAVVGAAAAGEWIARSIAQLAKAARTIGRGEPTSPVATSLREVNDVGDALSRASHDRQRAEAAMRESDMRFRAIVDQDTAGISIVDLDGRFRFANRRHCEITGYSVEEIRQHVISQGSALMSLPPPDLNLALDKLNRLSEAVFLLKLLSQFHCCSCHRRNRRR